MIGLDGLVPPGAALAAGLAQLPQVVHVAEPQPHVAVVGLDVVTVGLGVASCAGKLGSIDINRGDNLLGWDTDQFPTDLYQATYAMMVVLNQGGLGSGGLNFDAKLRRGSTDSLDLFYAHIGGMDTFARGLVTAQKIIDDGLLSQFINNRYASYETDLGKRIMKGDADFDELEAWVLEKGEPCPGSGRQEFLENLINSYL